MEDPTAAPPSDADDSFEPPEGAGLPMGGSLAEREQAREAAPKAGAAEALERSAQGDELGAQPASELLSYFLTNDDLPGDEETTDLAVKIGHGSRSREFVCKVRKIEWDEWDDSRKRATDDATGDFNTFVAASYMVARALREPKLGPAVQQLRAEKGESAPGDAAALLRQMFRRQAGALLELNGKILEISKLQMDNNSVREVEAGKT